MHLAPLQARAPSLLSRGTSWGVGQRTLQHVRMAYRGSGHLEEVTLSALNRHKRQRDSVVVPLSMCIGMKFTSLPKKWGK